MSLIPRLHDDSSSQLHRVNRVLGSCKQPCSKYRTFPVSFSRRRAAVVRQTEVRWLQCVRLSIRAETALNESQSEAEAKAKNYYISCLDPNQTVERLGAQPLLDLIHSQFSAWTVNWDLGVYDFQDTLEKIHALGMSSFFQFFVGQDEKEPTKNILQASFDERLCWF